MKKQAQEIVKMDLAKIFFTPPNTKKERIILILMTVITFMIFFGPICFSDIPPLRAVLLTCMPTLSAFWGVMILLCARFRKENFCKQCPVLATMQ